MVHILHTCLAAGLAPLPQHMRATVYILRFVLGGHTGQTELWCLIFLFVVVRGITSQAS
jgi:hypothetical protein